MPEDSIDRAYVSIARRELRMLQRHHGEPGWVSRLFMAHFRRQHPLPVALYLEVAREAQDHPRHPGQPAKTVALDDGRRAEVDHTTARIDRRAPALR